MLNGEKFLTTNQKFTKWVRKPSIIMENYRTQFAYWPDRFLPFSVGRASPCTSYSE